MRLALAGLAAALAFPVSASAMPARSGSYTPSDPLAPKQYYLTQDHAFDAFPDPLPGLSPVRVAIIDSGLDGTHPEFPRSRIIAARSFVGGSALMDEQGHGTFVAGIIAAALNNEGIAGIAFPAQLIIAKIAGADGSISVGDEAAAIRWAVDRGAQVINLSIGGVRDPLDRRIDTYSPTEANAVEYAERNHVVLVAALGNSDESPSSPWPYASYPAALPHTIGVSALTPGGDAASFSNRDRIYNDISAPGQEIISTFPRPLTAHYSSCVDQGYSDCGPDEYRHAAGTSFAAPQVTAAAALLLATKPSLRPEQVSNILERTATDVNASNGCKECPLHRDLFSGWGRLDIAGALNAAADGFVPPPDRLEPNDDAGTHAPVLPARVPQVKATLDFWDDDIDVYRVRLQAGQRLRLALQGPPATNTDLLLWKPGTKRVNDLRAQHMRAAQSIGPGASHRIAYRIPATGWYYVEVKLTSRGSGSYTLSVSRK